MGLFAIGMMAFGNSSGFDVNVDRDAPGPHNIRAWKPGEGIVVECGIRKSGVAIPSGCIVVSMSLVSRK